GLAGRPTSNGRTAPLLTPTITKTALLQTCHGFALLREQRGEGPSAVLAVERPDKSVKLSHESLETRSVATFVQVDDKIARATRIRGTLDAPRRRNATVVIVESEKPLDICVPAFQTGIAGEPLPDRHRGAEIRRLDDKAVVVRKTEFLPGKRTFVRLAEIEPGHQIPGIQAGAIEVVIQIHQNFLVALKHGALLWRDLCQDTCFLVLLAKRGMQWPYGIVEISDRKQRDQNQQ